MFSNTNVKSRQTKLLAAFAIIAMVACVFAVVMPAEDASGLKLTAASDDTLVSASGIQNGAITIDSGADLVEVLNNEAFAAVTTINVVDAKDSYTIYENDSTPSINVGASLLTGGKTLDLTGKTLNMGEYLLALDGVKITGGTIAGIGSSAATKSWDALVIATGGATIENVAMTMALNDTTGFPIYAAVVVFDSTGEVSTDATISGGSITAETTTAAPTYGAIQTNANAVVTVKNVDIVGDGLITIQGGDKFTFEGMQDIILNFSGVNTENDVTINAETITMDKGSNIAETVIGWDLGNSCMNTASDAEKTTSKFTVSSGVSIDLGTVRA